VPVTANRWLLQDVLKGEWGFAGTLITDWDNVGRMVWEQQVQPDYEQAAAVAVRAGNDLVMATPRFFAAAQAAVRNGLLAEAELDDAVRRILRLKFELGLFEDPRAPDPERQAAVIGCADHTALNLEVARRALVLLRNDGTLPLEGGLLAGDDGRADPHGPPRTIAVIGPNADDPHALLGDWAGASGQVPWMLPDGHPRALVQTVLDGFRAVVPEDWQVVHARGADIREPVDPTNPVDPANPVDGAQAEDPRAPRFTPAQPDPALLADAVAAAESADWAVVVVGDTIELVGEYRSTATLELQGGQLALLDAVAATGTPMLVVLVHSKPAVLPPAVLGAAAIVEAFNPGMQGGRAIAELVLGLIEPQGRLPISVPRHAGQLPVYYNQVRGQHGDRYADLTQEPQFAFGEGLTYTRVDYADLMLARDVLGPDDVVRAQVTLANRGTRPAHELVQAYVSDVVTSVTWAARELKAWRRVVVLPGERVVVELEVPVSACTIVAADGRRCVEPGAFDLLVGPSSKPEDLLGARFTVVD
jgi:beta-glucosidase